MGEPGGSAVGEPTAGESAARESAVSGRRVLIAGASSKSGIAVASALSEAGATVIAVGSNRERLDALLERVPGAKALVCDLSDASAVAHLAKRIHTTLGMVDGVIHLVGGWRAGGGIAGQTDQDWAFLDRSFATLRITTRKFYYDLVASPAGRLAIVSPTVVEHPLAGGANYAAAKAAAEAWTLAVAQGFRKAESSAAATIFVVKELAGLEPELAHHVVDLWKVSADELNGTHIRLGVQPNNNTDHPSQ
ncbi:MAG: alcohol dehydrogenase [Leifsonia sp.]|jgi:NAD(P)-dependent dehydrogenase (short-subunit alcohol dehydrogenase family)|nr:alcohol dehydrogenase [Leifsonia sp.]